MVEWCFGGAITLLQALASGLWGVADGSYPTVIALAKKLGCHPDMMGRHMRRMKKAGLVIRVKPEDADERSKYYQIPAEFRSTQPDGRRVLDFGCLLLRFDLE